MYWYFQHSNNTELDGYFMYVLLPPATIWTTMLLRIVSLGVSYLPAIYIPLFKSRMVISFISCWQDDKIEDTVDRSPDRPKSQPDDEERRKEKRKSKRSKKKSGRKKHRRSKKTEGSSAAEKGSDDEGTSSEEDDEVRRGIHIDKCKVLGTQKCCFVSCAHATR